MKFDWDENKNQSNIKIHDGVSFEEAILVFDDEFAIGDYDDAHSSFDEKRFLAIGQVKNLVLFVVYTVRDENTENETYRIISARLAEPEEKKLYEQEKFGSGYFG